jgi:hypothetical protein
LGPLALSAFVRGLPASAAGAVPRVEFLGEPGLDQGLVWNVALVRGHLDLLEQTQRQTQRDRVFAWATRYRPVTGRSSDDVPGSGTPLWNS